MLPRGVPGSTHKNLSLFHVSSNGLTSLPSSIVDCTSLKTIYANANNINSIPLAFAKMKSLEKCNLSKNSINNLDDEFLARFGRPDKDGKCTKVRRFFVLLQIIEVIFFARIEDKYVAFLLPFCFAN